MIEINNLTGAKVDENLIKKTAQIVLKDKVHRLKGRKKNINLSIAFVGPSKIKKLNKKYRGKNQVTDVLAFSGNGKSNGELGEVIICLWKVKKNAKRFNSVFEEELTRVLIHGILHLLGYDHEKSKKEAKKMKKKEENYFSKVH